MRAFSKSLNPVHVLAVVCVAVVVFLRLAEAVSVTDALLVGVLMIVAGKVFGGRRRASTPVVNKILNFAGEGLYATNAKGQCLFVNEAAARMLGTGAAVLAGRNIHDLHHTSGEDDEPCDVCSMPAGAPLRGEGLFWRTDGTSFPVEYTSSSVEDGGMVSNVVTFNDISARKRSEAAVQESELKFRAVTESASDAIVSADATGNILAWNRGAQLIFGYDEEEVLGKPLTILMPEQYRDMHERGMGRFLLTGDARVIGTTVEVEGLRKDGVQFPVELSLAHWQRDERRFFTGILRDITERKKAEAALAREASFMALLQTVSVAANEASEGADALRSSVTLICEQTGWPVGHVYWVDESMEALLRSSDIWHITEEVDVDAFLAVTNETHFMLGEGLPGRVLEDGKPAWIIDVTKDDNFPRAQLVNDLGVRAAFGFPVLVGSEVVAVMEFFSTEALQPDEALTTVMGQIGTQLGRVIERQRAREAMAYQAMHDPLTGLPNRTLCLDRLTHALSRMSRGGGGVSVLFIDLDRFKLINDSYGHQAGDHLLGAVASRLGSVLRPSDTVARFGGDEFVVVCEDLQDSTEAAGVAERIAEALATPFAVDGAEVFVTSSIGIALACSPEDTPESLLRDADAALYQAKDEGRGRHELFSQELRTRSIERLDLVNALHRALERDEFRLHYQPQVTLSSQDIVGVEALVRWEHPQRGLIPPLDFIPLAEESGLINKLGNWVLTEACMQAARWDVIYPNNPRLSMAVNLSVKQFQQADLLDQITEALNVSGLSPERLQLEITESVLMHDTEGMIAKLEQIKQLGVRLAIDDFGTGYSSLTYLRRFPIDVLKIDKSFIDGLDGDAEQSAVAKTIVRLAQTLRLQTVAEGVESIEHVNELVSLSCDKAQGYFFARPLTSLDFEALLLERNQRTLSINPINRSA